jgi:putative transcriptional regulator
MAAIHENAQALFEIGAIDKKTMKDFDETCLEPVQTFTAEQIKALRERERVSQPVFASYLNVTKGMVSAWERGIKSPSGPALRLLSLVDKNGLETIA